MTGVGDAAIQHYLGLNIGNDHTAGRAVNEAMYRGAVPRLIADYPARSSERVAAPQAHACWASRGTGP